jgi:Zn-dependent oligopeptidase
LEERERLYHAARSEAPDARPAFLAKALPVVTNNINIPKPSPGDPALLTRVPRDFVEMLSQFNEHWADEPSVFARYARHSRQASGCRRR